jgi:protein-tyrosine-phosphatase
MNISVFKSLSHDCFCHWRTTYIHDIKVHSRGTGSWNLGEPPHEGTQKILNKHNIPLSLSLCRMIASAIGERHILPRQTNATSTILIPPNSFVCLGNICRSPMAEAIMRQRLKDRNIHDIKVHSRVIH